MPILSLTGVPDPLSRPAAPLQLISGAQQARHLLLSRLLTLADALLSRLGRAGEDGEQRGEEARGALQSLREGREI